MPPVHGIDISNHQGAALERANQPLRSIVDWAYGVGVDLVCFKISEGRVSGDGRYDDGKRYVNVWREAAQEWAFPYTGVYHWLSNDIPAEAQRDNAAKRIGGLYSNECIQLDVEEAGLDEGEVRHAVAVWEETWPGRVFYYLGRYFDANLIDRLGIPAEKWWWPAYIPPMTVEAMVTRHHAPFKPAVWQWGGGGQGFYCPLVNGRIDTNEIVDTEAVRARCGYGQVVPVPPVPVPVPTSVEDDLMVVILAPRGANARFLAVMGKTASGAQVAVHVEWLRSEDEMRPFLNNGVQVVECDATDLVNVSVDAVPVGDVVSWTSANFRRVAA
jgi:hypothetical protein